MIAAVPIETKSRESKISSRFARSPFFAIIFLNAKEVRIIQNPCLNLKSGTGKCISSHLSEEHDVDTYIAFELGWKIQQMAYKSDKQLIILDNKTKSLPNVLKLLKIKL